MADPKRFLSTEIGHGCYGEFFHNSCGKPLNVTLGAQAISTDRNACMTISVGLGTTVFAKRVGVSSGNFKDYFGTTSAGANPTGFNTVFGTFYLGQDCNCPGSYCSSTSGVATFISCDGTVTQNWQGGKNPWNCCTCFCAGPYPDSSCSSWCSNIPWGGQEQINYALAYYHEYTGACWNTVWPYSQNAGKFQTDDVGSSHYLGYTNGGLCGFGPCRQEPTEAWMIHHCHAEDQVKASQVWINPYCCCGKCNWESNQHSMMAICQKRNDYNCGGYFDWYVITNNLPNSDAKKQFRCTFTWDGGCNVCTCEGLNFNCYTYKCPDHDYQGESEIYLSYHCRSGHHYCYCFCCACGRICRQRCGACCISNFTDCYSQLCSLCCWVHWPNGYICNDASCPMNPHGGVAGAMTHCLGVRHHKTFQTCQMYYVYYPWSCTFYCYRCSCQLRMLDMWICPPKYGTTSCNTNEYGVKYVSWNPAKCCAYMMIRSEDASQCGIFSWFGSCQKHYQDWQVGNDATCCVWPCDSTYFTKVADFPASMVADEKYYSPIMCTTCIHRVEKSLWAIGVYNCTDKRYDPFISSNLVDWSPSPTSESTCSTSVICSDPNNCIVEYMNSVCKWRICTSFEGAVCRSGMLDYKLAFSNYERTGFIIPDGGRLFIQNINSATDANIGTSFSFNVWGYEG